MNTSKERHRLLTDHPRKFLQIVNEEIRRNPGDPIRYLHRNWAWERLGRKDLALADLTRALSIEDHPALRQVRGILLGKMRRYEEAISDFDSAQMLDQEIWPTTPGPLHRALCHASLGNLEAATADCKSLPENHWMPGFDGEPTGSKQEVTDEIRRLAVSIRSASHRQPGDNAAGPSR